MAGAGSRRLQSRLRHAAPARQAVRADAADRAQPRTVANGCLLMNVERGMSLLVEAGQWAHCAFTDTVALAGGGVQLHWHDAAALDECAPTQRVRPGGLTFDRRCRAFRSRPERHGVDVVTDDGEPTPPTRGPFTTPLGLAVDRSQRLCIADPGEHAVWVIDLATGRMLRRVPTCGTPIDVAPHCGGVMVLIEAAQHLYTVIGRRGPVDGPAFVRPCYPHGLEPIKLTAGPIVLWRNADGDGAIATPDGSVLQEVAGATDLDVTDDGIVVVAREPGRSFARFAVDGSIWTEIEPIVAPGYDGGAITVDPRGHVAFTTESGIGWTVGSAARHVGKGTLVTYRMDSGDYRTRWGRMFLDACIPRDTTVRARFTPPTTTADKPDFGRGRAVGRLYRRPTGRERPWAQIDRGGPIRNLRVAGPRGPRPVSVDRTDTERNRTPDAANPGNSGRTAGHALLDTPPEIVVAQRHRRRLHAALPRPGGRVAVRAGPQGGPARRACRPVRNAAGGARVARELCRVDPRSPLARIRPPHTRRRGVSSSSVGAGPRQALRRMIAIYLGFEPQIIERWQLRGLGGTVLGTTQKGAVTPNIGASVRETGTLGRFTIGGTPLQPTSFATFAHQFTVLVNGTLTAEQRDVVCDLIGHTDPHTRWARQRTRRRHADGHAAGWADLLRRSATASESGACSAPCDSAATASSGRRCSAAASARIRSPGG